VGEHPDVISRGTVEQMVRGGERRWLILSNKAIAASEGNSRFERRARVYLLFWEQARASWWRNGN
jgi:hypothetical protein